MFSAKVAVRSCLRPSSLSALPPVALPAHAIAKTWNNGDFNEYSPGADDNWNPDEEPQPGGDALVPASANLEVNSLEIFCDLTNIGALQSLRQTDDTRAINIGDMINVITSASNDVDDAGFLTRQRDYPLQISAWRIQYGSGMETTALLTEAPEPTSSMLFFGVYPRSAPTDCTTPLKTFLSTLKLVSAGVTIS